MVTVAELLERVRAATGPDWKLDIAIECAIPDTRLGEHSHRPSNAHGKVTSNYPNGRSSTYRPRRYTGSVDDALVLVERVLPGWTYGMDKDNEDGGFWVHLYPDASMRTHPNFAPTLPLAILAALLTALTAKEPS